MQQSLGKRAETRRQKEKRGKTWWTGRSLRLFSALLSPSSLCAGHQW